MLTAPPAASPGTPQDRGNHELDARVIEHLHILYLHSLCVRPGKPASALGLALALAVLLSHTHQYLRSTSEPSPLSQNVNAH